MSKELELIEKLEKSLEESFKVFPLALAAAYRDGLLDGIEPGRSISEPAIQAKFDQSNTKAEIDKGGVL